MLDRQLHDLRSWRALLLPLSAFSTVLFFVSLTRTGNLSMETAFSFIAASSLNLWVVAILARIDAIDRRDL